MLNFTKLSIQQSGSKASGGRRVDPGFALLLVMIAATVLLIGLTAALPSIFQEGRREREAELIFRGSQYAFAVARFHQKFQRYPTTIEDLTKQTNGMRFLRKQFTDPMTSSGKWRFIHANAMGILLDSKTASSGAQGQGQPGTNQGSGGFGTSGGSNTGSASSQSGMGTSGFGQQSMGGNGFGQSNTGGSGFGQSSMGGNGFSQQGQQGMGGGQLDQSAGGFSQSSSSASGTSSAQGGSGFFGAGSQGGGTFIVGVASTSHKQSIRIWKQKTRYDEWEFVGVDMGVFGVTNSIPGLPQSSNGQQTQGGGFGQSNQGGGFGQSNQGGGFGQSNQGGGFGQSNQGSGFGQPQNPGSSPSDYRSKCRHWKTEGFLSRK